MRTWIEALVGGELSAPSSSLEAFLAARDRCPAVGSSVATAALSGLAADGLGFAFAAGYRAAMRRLVPALGDARAALCATERGGAHPRAIETSLVPAAGGFTLRGHKRWATLAEHVDVLLVVASSGRDGSKNQLRLVRVDARAPGVTLTRMPPTPFCPEIEHAEVALDDVHVAADDVLPGDGYDAYLKPFRTIEDQHVVGAALGFAIGCARRNALDPALVERALALIVALDAISAEPPLEPAVHLVLAGVLAGMAPLFEALVEGLGEASAVAARLRRDLPLLMVASGARAARTARAREIVAGRRGVSEG